MPSRRPRQVGLRVRAARDSGGGPGRASWPRGHGKSAELRRSPSGTGIGSTGGSRWVRQGFYRREPAVPRANFRGWPLVACRPIGRAVRSPAQSWLQADSKRGAEAGRQRSTLGVGCRPSTAPRRLGQGNLRKANRPLTAPPEACREADPATSSQPGPGSPHQTLLDPTHARQAQVASTYRQPKHRRPPQSPLLPAGQGQARASLSSFAATAGGSGRTGSLAKKCDARCGAGGATSQDAKCRRLRSPAPVPQCIPVAEAVAGLRNQRWRTCCTGSSSMILVPGSFGCARITSEPRVGRASPTCVQSNVLGHT